MTLADITEAIHAQRVRITDHADEEAVADDLSLRDVYRSVEHGEIIEEYPSDRPFPSCLVYGPTVEEAPVHSVRAYNEAHSVGSSDYRLSAGSRAVDRRAAAEAEMTMPFEKCPVCGSELIDKQVEKLLRGGLNTAVVTVFAEVCLRCGERLYSQATIERFAEIRAKLQRGETADFQPLGRSFQIT